MAAHFIAAVYGTGVHGGSSEGGSAGTYMSFPTENSIFYSSSAQPNPSVTTKSIIEVLPTGLRVQSKTYYTALTVDQLNTLAG